MRISELLIPAEIIILLFYNLMMLSFLMVSLMISMEVFFLKYIFSVSKVNALTSVLLNIVFEINSFT